MRIGIDARFYGSLGKGLGRYTSELIAQLEKIDRRNEYVVLLRRDNWDQYQPQAPNFRKELAEYHWYTWREQLLFPRLLRRLKLDLVHFTHFNVPLFYRRPFVVTVHDLILLQHPTTRASTLSPLLYRCKFLVYKLVISSALRRARAILTVSKTSREEIRKHFPFAERKQIVVTYGACAARFQKIAQATDAAPEQPAVSPKGPFMLYVGNAYPHKNLDRLIESFRLFRKRGHQNWHLFLVGVPDYFYKRLQREAKERNLQDGVTFFGHASDDELAALYRQAQFYIFPSLCEGFGLPPLEAMCAGLPVASSNESCLPEVLGEAALLFDPHEPKKIAAAMTRLAEDQDLRTELIALGQANAKRFDWTTTASKTLELYESCSNNADGQHQV